MKRLFPYLSLGWVFLPSLPAQDPGPSQDFTRMANQWMVSADAGKRKAAYRSWMQLAPETQPAYRKALEAAGKYHSKQLDALARGRTAATNPYAAHQELAKQLDEDRLRVMTLIKTDWKKDPGKIKMLRSEMAKLEKLWTRVNRLASADTKRFDAALDATIAGMMEVAREMERFDTSSETAALNDEDLKERMLKDHIEGCLIPTLRKRFTATRGHSAMLASVEKSNAALGRWATPTMKSFATLLNKERCILGLAPLRLEEKLSDATRGHSEDMARLGFFAHESPVTGKTSPWDRARLAGFSGNGTGENIFMGSSGFDAAYSAWFGSDGHRFIMFGDGCNVLGVGISGKHWTMMTGKS